MIHWSPTCLFTHCRVRQLGSCSVHETSFLNSAHLVLKAWKILESCWAPGPRPKKLSPHNHNYSNKIRAKAGRKRQLLPWTSLHLRHHQKVPNTSPPPKLTLPRYIFTNLSGSVSKLGQIQTGWQSRFPIMLRASCRVSAKISVSLLCVILLLVFFFFWCLLWMWQRCREWSWRWRESYGYSWDDPPDTYKTVGFFFFFFHRAHLS